MVGENALPTVELFDDNIGLIFAVAEVKPTPTATAPAQQDDAIELVVTGDRDGYNIPDAGVGTRTDTPLRDIPQSIKVIPQQVLEDQNVQRVSEALRNVAGAAIALLYVICAVCMFLIGLAGFYIPLLRNVERILPDHD